ncbi:MAG TPA: HAMP domain-containing sensor histidine kinase [Gemmata sp.]|nr:HAMP domain-containing sensor histidine kinase [Gemmata sp.]
MPGKAAGRAAADLPWLCPTTDSLIALADAPASAVGLSDADPALAIFLLRFAQPAAEPDAFGFAPGALFSASLPAAAAAYLTATRAGVLPTRTTTYSRVREVSDRAGQLAARIADATRLAPPPAAATVARLAPLGWYGVLAADPDAAGDPLADPNHASRPAEVQSRVWGLDQAAVARRLASRWRLPAWVATTVGCLTLPLRVAGPLVPYRDLFAIVQLAVMEAEAATTSFGLTHGADRAALLGRLRVDPDTLAPHEPAAGPQPAAAGSGLDPDPHRVPLVRNLLRMAAESRRRNGPALVARLEEQVDHLHRVAAELGEQAGARLRDAKLAGLAELAAGAGHEINNPLAVISGTAQRLLRWEDDPDRRDSLQVIVRQTHRIAGILRDLMTFARPPRPHARAFTAAELLAALTTELSGLAEDRRALLEVEESPAGIMLEGDPGQLGEAVRAVVRNAIEASPPDGWVKVAVASPDDSCEVTITVEDSGPGLSGEVAEHAFDPFYCGRSAGRGRGLGLSTAWQLVRQNGGDLSYQPDADSPTRFVFTLRRAVGVDILALRSA